MRMKCELCVFWNPLHGASGNCIKTGRITMATDGCAEGVPEDI